MLELFWDLLKWGLIFFFGGFYILLAVVLIVKIVRGLATPIDEVEIINHINSQNKKEIEEEWARKDYV